MLDQGTFHETTAPVSVGPDLIEVDRAVIEAAEALKALQDPDGEWRFELEADATIPAEYILLEHFTGEVDDRIERKLAAYLRGIQADHGGWPLFHGGELNISASVKAYYALKLVGDDPSAPHMVRARKAILAHGGAAKANVEFSRGGMSIAGGTEAGGTDPGVIDPGGTEPDGTAPRGTAPGGTTPGCTTPGGAEKTGCGDGTLARALEAAGAT
jgi:squalene-hopene/tetraprenyl-beta-curcumene cyclase